MTMPSTFVADAVSNILSRIYTLLLCTCLHGDLLCSVKKPVICRIVTHHKPTSSSCYMAAVDSLIVDFLR